MSLFGCGTSPAAVQPYFEISLESQLERLSDIKKPHLLIDLLIASKEKPLFLDPRTISSLFTKSLSPININDQDKNGQTLLYKIVNQIIKSESDFDLYELFIPNLLDFYPEIDSLKADKDPILLLLKMLESKTDSGNHARTIPHNGCASLCQQRPAHREHCREPPSCGYFRKVLPAQGKGNRFHRRDRRARLPF